MIEYNSMAKYYDLFYSNKSYERETDFLKELIGNRKTVLDVGCGTGVHMHLLEDSGYIVDGLDLNSGMLDIAKTRVKGNLIEANLLDFNIKKKYDSIISMFAVFNHLNDYNEFEEGIMHCYKYLNENGILIIDLHNGRKSGEKVSEYKDYKSMYTEKLVVMLDHLEDPHNFGATIRSCEAAGVYSVIIPKDRGVSVNPTVMKTSAGALERVNIAMVNNLNKTILDFKKNGFFVYGADMDGSNYKDIDFADKVLLIIGNEGKGMSRLVRESCDEIVSIPQYGKINSLNASVAAGIIIYGIINR